MSTVITSTVTNRKQSGGPKFLVGVDSLILDGNPIVTHPNIITDTYVVPVGYNAATVGPLTIEGELVVDGELSVL